MKTPAAGTPETASGDGAGTPEQLASQRGQLVPSPLAPEEPSVLPAYRLELRPRPAQHERAWTASLEGTTPAGTRVERRDFESLIDLMRFLEAMVTARGLR